MVKHIHTLRKDILTEQYEVSAVRKVEIPKPDGGKRVLGVPTVKDRLKDRIREITRRNRGVKFEVLIKELNLIIIGWTNYFKLANSWLTTFRDLDSWIRRKLRCYRLKQCGRRYTIYKFLHSLGIPESKSWNVVMYSQGFWQMSIKQAVGNAMNLSWFTQYGLQSLFFRMNG